MARRGTATVDGPIPEWVEEAQELLEVAAATGWTEEVIENTPGFTLDAIRQLADIDKQIDRERQAEAIARALRG